MAPNPPGGGYDLVARVVGQQLAQQFGQQFIIENRTGAGTLVGTEALAKAPADGYTLLVGGFSNISANAGLYKTLPYNPAEFAPAGMVVSYSFSSWCRGRTSSSAPCTKSWRSRRPIPES